jgi:phage tail sheath protein FI
MPRYVTPGVYFEDNQRGPRPIEGVPTSIAAFLGETERGTTTPRLVTSYTEYTHWFGDVVGNRDRYLPYAASAFFQNGGEQLYVCRLTRASSVYASL